jgi:hypothetical protein
MRALRSIALLIFLRGKNRFKQFAEKRAKHHPNPQYAYYNYRYGYNEIHTSFSLVKTMTQISFNKKDRK